MKSSIRQLIGVGLCCVWAAAFGLAQTTTATSDPKHDPTFDVVSIRRLETTPPFRGVAPASDRLHAILPLRQLVARAYGIRPEFVFGGPKWTGETLFELTAKLNETDIPAFAGMSLDEKVSLLKPVLTARFGVQTHSERRVLKVYDLVIARPGLGPEFKPTKNASGGMAVAGENFSGTGVTLPQFTRTLSEVLASYIGRPILNKTGLTGTYDFVLRWSAMSANVDVRTAATQPNSHPDIFLAIQEQLGLKLQPARESVEVLIIDSATQPSEN